MADEKVEIEIVLDDGSIQKGFVKLENQAKKSGAKVDEAFSFKNITKALAGFAAGFAAFKGIKELTGFLKDSTAAANAENDAVNKLNTALSLTGKLLPGVSENMQDFASQLQDTTKFGNEAVLESAALIQQLANLDEKGLKRATQAAADLATGLGVDLSTATTLVAKGATGAVESFTRYGIAIKKGATETETLSNLLTALEKKFGGSAVAAAKTFSGQTIILQNAFSDFQKQIGKFITQSPALITTLGVIGDIFKNLTKSLSGSGTDIFKNIIINFSLIAQAGVQTANEIGDSFVLAYLRASQAWQAFKVLTTAGLSDTFNQQLSDTNSQIDAILNKDYSDNPTIKFFDDLIAKVQQTSGSLLEFGAGFKNVTDSIKIDTFGVSDAWAAYTSAFEMQKTNLVEGTSEWAAKTNEKITDMKKYFAELGVAARNDIGKGMGAGFAAFGKALVSGENALAAFGKAMLGALGQAAVSEGTSMILRGIGYSIDPLMAGFGPPLIAAGSALAAFGGVLSAVGGGGASAPSGGGVSPGLSDSATPTATTAENIPEKTTSVAINVEGTVLDPVSVGNQIAQILNDTFDAGGTKVVTV